MIKKWRIDGQIKEEEMYFTHKNKAIDAAKRLLRSGMKRVVHISKLDESSVKAGISIRGSYRSAEIWELVNGTPKRTDNMRY